MSVQEEQVREYWSYCGEIEDLDLMRFPDTGRFKGIAFVTFAEVAPSTPFYPDKASGQLLIFSRSTDAGIQQPGKYVWNIGNA